MTYIDVYCWNWIACFFFGFFLEWRWHYVARLMAIIVTLQLEMLDETDIFTQYLTTLILSQVHIHFHILFSTIIFLINKTLFFPITGTSFSNFDRYWSCFSFFPNVTGSNTPYIRQYGHNSRIRPETSSSNLYSNNFWYYNNFHRRLGERWGIYFNFDL